MVHLYLIQYSTHAYRRIHNRFVKILYIFDIEGYKLFHGQWLTHSSKTLLQELAHPNELFLLNICDDCPVRSILRRANVTQLPLGTDVPAADAATENLNMFYLKSSYLFSLRVFIITADMLSI